MTCSHLMTLFRHGHVEYSLEHDYTQDNSKHTIYRKTSVFLRINPISAEEGPQ